ncbi:cell wall-binding repeat-containing protein [Agromyces sp. M3QZ16-3]|uniref:cell wall-binding repeat-containing protein n=1 Tax=Agromyces sp. M3QZ16-3 TaxID=3447585 RepID=UPI003F68E757
MSRSISRSLLAAICAIPLVLGVAVPADAAESTGTVRGTISDPAGGLLIREETNITVSLYSGDELDTPVLSTDLLPADYGGFEITAVPAGRYSVKFDVHNRFHVGEWWGDTRRAAERAFIDVAEGGTIDLDVRLSAPVALRGTVTGRDAPAVRTDDDIRVSATSGDAELDAWLPGRIGTSDVPGEYSLRLLPGTYDLSFVDATGAHRPLTVPDVVVAPEGTTRDVVLEAARASIGGTVSLRTASGVAPADVAGMRLYTWSADAGEWVVSSGWCGRGGAQFLVDCLSAGRYKLSVLVLSSGLAEAFWGGTDLASASVIELAEGETRSGVDIVVDDPAGFSGVMAERTSDGTILPVSGGRVTVWRKTPAGGFEPHPITEDGRGVDQLAANADGTFHGSLPPGTYLFKLWHDRYPYTGATYFDGARFLEDATEITLGLGEHRDLGTIVLPASSFSVERIAGADRFATAVAVSQRIVSTGQRAPVVYLTNAFDFPDALGAGPAAMRAGGVILPVSQGSVPAAVAAELRRIRPERVVIAGGSAVVSDAVRDAVREMVPAGTDLVRLGGTSRYETADLIVRDAFSAGGSRHAIVATGRTYPDALAAGPAAGHLDAPVLLVDGQHGLQASTKATIEALGITEVHIVGGTGAVGTSLESGLSALLGDAHVTRLAGADRIFTAIAVNEEIFGATDTGYLATAGGFADALAGGPLAAMEGAPLYLSSPGCVNYWALQSIRERQIARLTLLGGTGVLSSGVAQLTTCR